MRFLILLIVLVPGSLLADPVLRFNTPGSATNFNETVGWEFDVLSPITVTGVGWYDQGLDGLQLAHTVGIWNSSGGTLLASAVVAAGTTDSLDGLFRTATITPIVLSTGDYIVGGQNFASNTEQLAFDVLPTIEDPNVSFVGGMFSVDPTFELPTKSTSVADCCWGPSFSVSAAANVPEPTDASALLAIGVLAAALLARRRHPA